MSALYLEINLKNNELKTVEERDTHNIIRLVSFLSFCDISRFS